MAGLTHPGVRPDGLNHVEGGLMQPEDPMDDRDRP